MRRLIIIGNSGVRLISPKRARYLRKRGEYVGWSSEHNSYFWDWSALIARQFSDQGE